MFSGVLGRTDRGRRGRRPCLQVRTPHRQERRQRLIRFISYSHVQNMP